MKIKRTHLIALLASPLASVVMNVKAAAAEPFQRTITYTVQQTQEQPPLDLLTQFERIYVSTDGDFLGAHTIVENTAIYINRDGHISLSTRDYTAELDYDYRGRLQRIGTAELDYDYLGRVQQVGITTIDYDYRSRLSHIGAVEIRYTPRGKVAQIGDVEIRYDRNLIDTISANYTSSGARVIVVSGRHT